MLKPYTTFKIGGPARYFVLARTEVDFRAALNLAERESLPFFVLGGGSNILVDEHGFEGVVVHPVRRGVTTRREDAEGTTLEVSAAEAWDEVVRYTVEQNWWGIENLSHIPGQAGAALVQNIGAYGQQISDVLESARVMDCAIGTVRLLDAGGCGFGYRRSIFNTSARGRFIILGLTLRLSKRPQPNLGYPDLRAYFAERQVAAPILADIRQAIITIRDRKFPFPREERVGTPVRFLRPVLRTGISGASLEPPAQLYPPRSGASGRNSQTIPLLRGDGKPPPHF